jgi:hypothetical protein
MYLTNGNAPQREVGVSTNRIRSCKHFDLERTLGEQKSTECGVWLPEWLNPLPKFEGLQRLSLQFKFTIMVLLHLYIFKVVQASREEAQN